jgi:hypothetical protein
MPPKLEPDEETGRVQIVAPQSWIDRLTEWRRKQPDLPNASEAIRRLVDRAIGLDEKRKSGEKP